MNRFTLVLLLVSCKGGDERLAPPERREALAPPERREALAPPERRETLAPDAKLEPDASIAPPPSPPTASPAQSTLQPELVFSDAGSDAPPNLWTASYSTSSTFNRMTYGWSVSHGAGELHASRQVEPKPPTRKDVKFRASDASLRALAAGLQKDDCCATWRASTCGVPDAPPARIYFELGSLKCAASATPECADDKMRRCFAHLTTFVHTACGAACE
jgi:hypothetical protein